jgi:hypothetical protein
VRVRVTFEVEVPLLATDEEVHEWLRFMLNDNGQMKNSNPLSNEDVEPVFGTFEWERIG